MEDQEILYQFHFSMYLRSNKVESGPPLSTILGNYGINTVSFVDDLNDYTEDLPDYFLLKVDIFIFEDKTYEFEVNIPTVSALIRLCSFNKALLIKGSGGYISQNYRVVKLIDLVYISY
jgi:ribosomal protein L11